MAKEVVKPIQKPQDVPPAMERQFVSPEQPRQMGRMSESEVAAMLGAEHDPVNGAPCVPMKKATPPGNVKGTPKGGIHPPY